MTFGHHNVHVSNVIFNELLLTTLIMLHDIIGLKTDFNVSCCEEIGVPTICMGVCHKPVISNFRTPSNSFYYSDHMCEKYQDAINDLCKIARQGN